VTIAQSCLSHPFIVHTHFYWQSRRYLYIITDYVENGELLSLWLRIRRFPQLIVQIYIAQVAMVLDYLHSKGIIYRDVKMENILLDENGNIKIIDFGLSKWLSLGQRTSTICGTLQCKLNPKNYFQILFSFILDIAPEVLSVRPYDHRVDWWSLGILMYACLFGEYPVSATKDHVTMANKVLNHTFNLPSIAVENKFQVRELLFQLLEKNPNQRLCTLDELRQTSFMSKIDFNRVYSKYYSPLEILMNIKSEWRKELELHYNYREKELKNGKYSLSSSSSLPQQKIFYQNIDNQFFQKFSK
jgi:serine/threonine protein kinase